MSSTIRTVLRLQFGTVEGATRTMTIANPKLGMSGEEIEFAMDKIINNNLFVHRFNQALGASYVTTETVPVDGFSIE